MKRSEVRVIVTLRDILDAPLLGSWDEYCHKTGTNPYYVAHGGDADEKVEISLEDAEYWGIIED